jgi:hypothetical protein
MFCGTVVRYVRIPIPSTIWTIPMQALCTWANIFYKHYGPLVDAAAEASAKKKYAGGRTWPITFTYRPPC